MICCHVKHGQLAWTHCNAKGSNVQLLTVLEDTADASHHAELNVVEPPDGRRSMNARHVGHVSIAIKPRVLYMSEMRARQLVGHVNIERGYKVFMD